METGIEQRGTSSIVPRFVTCSVTCFVYPLLLVPHNLKHIIATGICREPVVRVTFEIKKNQRALGWPDTTGIISMGESRKSFVCSS